MTADIRTVSASGTEIGKLRKLNEDAILDQFPCFIVADGMGGHAAGEVASAIVVEELSAIAHGELNVETVHGALHRSKLRIDQVSAGGSQRPAGTTVSGVILVVLGSEPYWLVVNLGDSRTYHVTRGEVSQVSVDHSEVQELVDAGRLDAGSARTHAHRNIITRVLGAGTRERPDYWLLPVSAHDRWLVCSDGLTIEVTDEDITGVLVNVDDPKDVVDKLIDTAMEAGGHDNISVIVVDSWRMGADDEVETTVRITPQLGSEG